MALDVRQEGENRWISQARGVASWTPALRFEQFMIRRTLRHYGPPPNGVQLFIKREYWL